MRVAVLEILWFLDCGTRIGFNRHIHLCPWFKARFPTLFVNHLVVNTNLPIQVVSTVNVDLGFFWLAWKGGLDNLLDGSSQLFAFLAHRQSRSWDERRSTKIVAPEPQHSPHQERAADQTENCMDKHFLEDYGCSVPIPLPRD